MEKEFFNNILEDNLDEAGLRLNEAFDAIKLRKLEQRKKEFSESVMNSEPSDEIDFEEPDFSALDELDFVEDEPNMDVDLTPEEQEHAHEDTEDLGDDFWAEFNLEEDE